MNNDEQYAPDEEQVRAWCREGTGDYPDVMDEWLDRFLARIRRDAQADALRDAADGLMENIDWSDGRSSYGDNDGYEASARELRARATDIEKED